MKLSELTTAAKLKDERMEMKRLLEFLSNRPNTMLFKWPFTAHQDHVNQKAGRTGANVPSWLVPLLRDTYEKAAKDNLQHIENMLEALGVCIDD